MHRSAIFVLVCGALWAAGSLQAANHAPAGRPATVRDTPQPKTSNPPEAPGAATPALRIARVRLEAPPEDAAQPSMVLKFDLLNEGLSSVTDVVIEIVIRDKRLAESDPLAARPLVGPFTISGHATIDAGYTIAYEMLLRNLSTECQCAADVRVISARSVSGAGV